MSASPNEFTGVQETDLDALPAGRMLVHETSQMREADADGVIAVADSETREIIRWDQEGPLLLFALGANDAAGVTYRLKLDGNIVAATASPLGSITSPFSFQDVMGQPIQANETISLEVINQSGGTLNFAARLFVAVMG